MGEEEEEKREKIEEEMRERVGEEKEEDFITSEWRYKA